LKKTRIIGIIPARYGSTRFPGKALARISGKPMIRHVYERAKKASLVGKVMVATDDERIARVVRDFGGEAVMTPAGCASGTDRVARAAKKIPCDIVVNIQGDEPLIPPSVIDGAVRLLISDKSAVMGTVVKRITDKKEIDDPDVVKAVVDRNGYAVYFSRAAIPSPACAAGKSVFYKHMGIYAYRRKFLLRLARMKPSYLEKMERLEQLRVIEGGYRIKAYVSRHDSIAVDTRRDIKKVIKKLGIRRKK